MELNIRDGFHLTSIYPTDKTAYLEHFNDISISYTIPVIPYPYTEAAADWWIQHRLESLRENGREISFALRNPEGYLIGSVGVDDLKVGKAHKAEIGYWLAKPGFLTTPLKACACAGEQGSRGEFKYQVLSPLPLCPSAPLLHQTLKACEKCG